MGQRICFFKNNFNKKLEELIRDHYQFFRQWYLDTEKSSLEEFNESFGNEQLKDFLRLNANLTSLQEIPDKKIIDELTAEFIGSYCDLTDPGGKLYELFGPMMKTYAYESSTEMVSATKNPEFIKLWNFLIHGRSLNGDLIFDGYTKGYKIGYLQTDEATSLKNYIEYYFGNLDTIKKRHASYVDAKEESKYTIGFHKQDSGLEYVLEAISELSQNNKELITGIEEVNY